MIIRKGNEKESRAEEAVEEVITRLFFKMLLLRYDKIGNFSKILNHPFFQNYLLPFLFIKFNNVVEFLFLKILIVCH